VLRGAEKAAFDDARHKESDALKRLTKAAERLLRDARGTVGANVLSQIEEGLRAAAITEEGRELLARGRFIEPPTSTGFEAFAGIDVPKTKPRRAPKKQRDTQAIREAAATLRELEQRHRTAERAAKKAQAEADALADEVAAAERRLRELRG
jgi:DNA-binding PadR family transcriptional regulator